MYLGGLFETPVPGGVVGPTFACIIGNQFSYLKGGDRFYYENGPSITSFRLNQLNEIKKITMARLICNDFDITVIQKRAFEIPSQEYLFFNLNLLLINIFKLNNYRLIKILFLAM